MEYILFIHNNMDQQPTNEQWNSFFAKAVASGMFNGGSEMGKSAQLGRKSVTPVTKSAVGYMRFETDDIEKLHKLLESHPAYIQGGTLELCELPKT